MPPSALHINSLPPVSQNRGIFDLLQGDLAPGIANRNEVARDRILYNNTPPEIRRQEQVDGFHMPVDAQDTPSVSQPKERTERSKPSQEDSQPLASRQRESLERGRGDDMSIDREKRSQDRGRDPMQTENKERELMSVEASPRSRGLPGLGSLSL